MIWSIIYYFLVVLGLGFLVDLLVKSWDADFLEKLVIRIGAGTLMIPVIGVLFNHLHIPIHWAVFLVVSLLMVSFALHFRKKRILNDFSDIKRAIKSKKIKKSYIYSFLALILFVISAQMYLTGSFAYPWLEDGDPYGYATSAKYISIEKTYSAPFYFNHFSEPYPQGFQIFLGLMHQTNDSINWTVKFFTALVVSLSILFFFYFVRKASGSYEIAFWSTLILTAIPAWLSHFIFSLNFNMALMLVLFYAIFSLDDDSNWKYIAGILYGSLFINHFYTAFVTSVLLVILYFLKVLVYKRFFKENIAVFLIGLGIGLAHWVPSLYRHWDIMVGDIRTAQIGGLDVFQPLIMKFLESPMLLVGLFAGMAIFMFLWIKNELWFVHVKKVLKKKHVDYGIYLAGIIAWTLLLVLPSEKIMEVRGSADRVYTLADFFFAQQGNMINNPFGIGLIAMLLFTIGLVLLLVNYKKLFAEKNFFYLLIITWVIFTFLGVKGTSLSIAFAPFRMWTYFGMSLSIVAGFGLFNLLSVSKLVSKEKIARTGVKVLLALGIVYLIYLTSFSQKYWHNTAIWPEHQILIPESRELFIWMKDGGLPKDSMVLPLCNHPPVSIAYDMLAEPWKTPDLMQERHMTSDPIQFYVRALNESVDENYAFMKNLSYKYVIFGADCIAKMGANQTLLSTRLQEMINSSKFSLVKNTKTEFLFRVN